MCAWSFLTVALLLKNAAPSTNSLYTEGAMQQQMLRFIHFFPPLLHSHSDVITVARATLKFNSLSDQLETKSNAADSVIPVWEVRNGTHSPCCLVSMSDAQVSFTTNNNKKKTRSESTRIGRTGSCTAPRVSPCVKFPWMSRALGQFPGGACSASQWARAVLM